MYGLPVGMDLSGLRGSRLGYVAVGRHQVILNFSKDVSITIEGGLRGHRS